MEKYVTTLGYVLITHLGLVHLHSSHYSHAKHENATTWMRCCCFSPIPWHTTNTSPWKKKEDSEKYSTLHYKNDTCNNVTESVLTLLGEIRSKCAHTGENLLFLAYSQAAVYQNSPLRHSQTCKSPTLTHELWDDPLQFISVNTSRQNSKHSEASNVNDDFTCPKWCKPRCVLHLTLPGFLDTRFKTLAP